MAPHQRQAYRDYCKFDPNNFLHGSIVFGLAGPDSDLDIVTHAKIYAIKHKAEVSKRFFVKDFLPRLRIPRIILLHENGVELDVVPLKNCNDFVEKDVKIGILCSVPFYKEYIKSIRAWHKTHSDILITKNGFPSSFNLILVGLFYLQNRPLGSLLPVWIELQGPESLFVYSDAVRSLTTEVVFQEYLSFLVGTASHLEMNLNKKYQGEWIVQETTKESLWTLTDPASSVKVCEFKDNQAETISLLASEYLKHGKRIREVAKVSVSCNVCKESFETDLQRSAHILQKHTFPCLKVGCKLVFSYEDRMLKHYKQQHERAFVCQNPGCGREFGTEKGFLKHVKTMHKEYS
jgi:hypothetical protein